MKKLPQDVLEMPNYTAAEVVRYFHLSYHRLNYWTSGGRKHALVQLAPGRVPLISFKNLVEFYVLEGLRDVHKVRMSNIRLALTYMLNNSTSRHPFADYEIRTDNRDVWFFEKGHPVNASRGGQIALNALVGPYLQRVLRTPRGLAEAIFPLTRKEYVEEAREKIALPNIVEIDPLKCFGLPVLAGTRITIPFLAGRHRGGESIPAIAASYGRPVAEIQEAVEWEIGQEVKAA
jgi:uncharacterized protein (DUF433 family)